MNFSDTPAETVERTVRLAVVRRIGALVANLDHPRGGVVVVVVLGVDRLSQLNDTWGYETGDVLLEEITARLKLSFPGEATTRLGADQFVICCRVDESDDVEAEMATRALDGVTGRYVIRDHAVYVTASVGVAATADRDDEPEALLSAAEAARVEARRSGGRRWERANQTTRIRVREQVRTEQALHDAIENRELKVRYQPIVDFESGAVVCIEALARWNSPLYGTIEPTDFIQRAEETGLIVPLGHWLLPEVSDRLSRWDTIDDRSSPPDVAINVSGVQFRLDTEKLVGHLVEVAGRLPCRLWVEITESTLLEDPDGTRATLEELKSAGIGLVIDDFGTGYSSLNQLRLLPVDAIKIDRMFVSRLEESPRDRAIVQAMIQLAHALDIVAIAEGVETEAQFRALDKMSCDQVQGFLLSPAITSDEMLEALTGEGREPPWTWRPSHRAWLWPGEPRVGDH